MIKELLGRIKKNSFLSSSIAYIFASFVIKGISFITTPIFTRLMGTADYGKVTNFNTWGMFFASFICLQVAGSIVSANVSVGKNRINAYMNSIVKTSIIATLLFATITLLISDQISTLIAIPRNFIWLLIIYSFGSCMSETYSGYCIATNRVKGKVIFSILTLTSVLGFSILGVVVSEDKANGRILGSCIAYTFISLFVVIYFLKNKIDDKKLFKGDAKFALLFGVPLIPHLIANIVNGNSDRVFIIRYLGETEAGIYSVAYSIGVLALVFANACNDAWTPWYFDKSLGNKRYEIRKYFLLYSLTIIMCFVGVMFLSPEIMNLMAPDEYSEGIECIPYVALGISFVFLYRFPVSYEQLRSSTKYIAYATILASITNVSLNIYFVPTYGIVGAAITTTISYVVLWVLHEIVARKIIKGYDIHILSYLPSIVTAITGFVLSKFFMKNRIKRITILVFLCAMYFVYVYFALREKQTRGGNKSA